MKVRAVQGNIQAGIAAYCASQDESRFPRAQMGWKKGGCLARSVIRQIHQGIHRNTTAPRRALFRSNGRQVGSQHKVFGTFGPGCVKVRIYSANQPSILQVAGWHDTADLFERGFADEQLEFRRSRARKGNLATCCRTPTEQTSL